MARQPTADEVRLLVGRLLESPLFAGKRRGELLRYLVDRSLAGDAAAISEYAIGLDVFRKPESFDPRTESTVRAEMSRLRKALAEYYAGPGSRDAWHIEFPSGGYVPVFSSPGPPRPNLTLVPPRHRRWLAVMVAALALSAFALWRVAGGPARARSVVVLPFVNLTGDPSNDYLADGLTEDLTDALAHSASLRVVARTSAFQFKGKAADIREIGRRVDADTVIEGSLQKTGERLRITVQVNRAADGYHIFSRAFEAPAQELGRLQQEMALPVLSALRPGARPSPTRTPDPEALDLVLRARALRGYGDTEKFNQMVTLLNQAIQRDPQYAVAWADLSNDYASAATTISRDPQGSAVQAKAAAARALALDPSSAEAYMAEGYAGAMVLLDWKRGEDELRHAIRLMPQSARAHQHLSNVLLCQGRFREALSEAVLAEQLDPLVANSGMAVAMVDFMSRDYGKALAQVRLVYAHHPDVPVLHEFIGMVLEAQGDYGQAMEEYGASSARYPADSEARTVHMLAAMGRREEARRRLVALEARQEIDPFTLAATRAALGDLDGAFAAMNASFEVRNVWALKVHPFLDPMRRDPRFHELLRRARFE